MDPAEVLRLIPQQKPFRFVDEITFVSDSSIVGHYTFQQDEFFYSGHFPGRPVTPGAILLESMCQIGLVGLGIYLLGLEAKSEPVTNWTTVLCDAEIELLKPVFPGERVVVHSAKVFWRMNKLRCRMEMLNNNETVVARATASGLGVRTNV